LLPRPLLLLEPLLNAQRAAARRIGDGWMDISNKLVSLEGSALLKRRHLVGNGTATSKREGELVGDRLQRVHHELLMMDLVAFSFIFLHTRVTR
jgi:hypothetical protein